jgi:ankyrin repeat protein
LTPLHVASGCAGAAACIKAIAAGGADCNAKAVNGGATPLHAAAATGSAANVEALLAAGADVAAADAVRAPMSRGGRAAPLGSACAVGRVRHSG